MPPARSISPHPEPAAAVLVVTPCAWTGQAVDAALLGASLATAHAAELHEVAPVCASGAVDAVVVDDRLLRSRHGPRSHAALDRLESLRLEVPAVPLLLLARERPADSLLRAAYGAGFWGVVEYPLGTSTWIEQLRAWTRGSRARRQRVAVGLVDPATGLYNARGLEQRAREIDAMSERRVGSHACAAFVVEDADGGRRAPGQGPSVEAAVADACHRAGRTSDVFARIADREFVVIALDTDTRGLERLVQRLAATLADVSDHTLSLRVRAGGGGAVPGHAASALDLVTLAAAQR